MDLKSTFTLPHVSSISLALELELAPAEEVGSRSWIYISQELFYPPGHVWLWEPYFTGSPNVESVRPWIACDCLTNLVWWSLAGPRLTAMRTSLYTSPPWPNQSGAQGAPVHRQDKEKSHGGISGVLLVRCQECHRLFSIGRVLPHLLLQRFITRVVSTSTQLVPDSSTRPTFPEQGSSSRCTHFTPSAPSVHAQRGQATHACWADGRIPSCSRIFPVREKPQPSESTHIFWTVLMENSSLYLGPIYLWVTNQFILTFVNI